MGAPEPPLQPHSVISLQFHLHLTESRLNNLFRRYHKPTPGAVGSRRVEEAEAGMTSRAGRLPDWEPCTDHGGGGERGPLIPGPVSLFRGSSAKWAKSGPSFSSHGIKRPHRPGTWVPPSPCTSLSWLGTLSCTPNPLRAGTASLLGLSSSLPFSFPSAMPGVHVHTLGTE